MTLMRNAKVVQNCYVVDDLEAACQRFHRLYGIGPFRGGGVTRLENHVHRGRPEAPIESRIAFVQSGEMNIELVQMVSTAPSAFRDMFPNGPPGGAGFHHVAMFCDDYEATRDGFVHSGYPVASEFVTGFGAKICYIDARSDFGHMIELYPENEVVRRMYDITRESAAGWDGGQLIIPWP